MKFLSRLFNKTPPPTLSSVADEEIPRYPPFARGLPTASVDRVLATQSELVDGIRHTLALPTQSAQTVLMPVIARYAAFTHLLPASEAHHHRGAGGLFRHGLEVAYWAALASEGVLFGNSATPLERKGQEPRWRLAVCLAGLLHDIGKPVSDLSILDREGNTQWNPYLENLTDWAAKNAVDRYFLRWRDKRHQRHEQFSVLVAERVLTPDCLSYLTQPGPEIMQAMLEAIAGVDRGSVLHALVIEADRKSVERDLKANHIPTDSSLGVPVEKYLLDAMRRLTGNGHWTANTRGSRVWHFKDGLHVVWKTGAQEVCELLAKDRIPGIPRDPDTLADILIERGLAIPRQDDEGRTYRYWRMMPGDMDIALYMLRLSSPELIYSGEPPVIVEGRLLDEADKGNASSKEDAQQSASKPEATQGQASPTQVDRAVSSTPAGEVPVATLAVTNKKTTLSTAEVQQPSSKPEVIKGQAKPKPPNRVVLPVPMAKSGLEVQVGQGIAQHKQPQVVSGQSIAVPAKPGQDKASFAVESVQEQTPSSAKPTLEKSGTGSKQTKPVNSKPVNSDSDEASVETTPVSDVDVVAESNPANQEAQSNILSASDDNHNAARTKAKTEADNWLSSQGSAGEWLRAAIIEHQNPPVVAVRVVDGLVFIPHPDMAVKLGRKPSESLELLDRAGLIEADIRTPMRKLREIEGIRGLMLNREASRCWLALAGDLIIPTGNARKPAATLVPSNTVPAAKQPFTVNKTLTPNKENRTSQLPVAEQPKKNGDNETAKPVSTIPLEREAIMESITDTGSADDLIRLIRQRDGLPCPVEETAEWLSVPYAILDWYLAQNTGITRSKLIVALHRHPETQLEGSSFLKVRKGGKA
jgi:conjugal transfer pilus assembly protein TraI